MMNLFFFFTNEHIQVISTQIKDREHHQGPRSAPKPLPSKYIPVPLLPYSDFCHHQVFLPLFEFHINEIILYIHLFLNSFTQYNEIHHVLCISSLFLLLCSISLHNHTTLHLLNHRQLDCFYYVSIILLQKRKCL